MRRHLLRRIIATVFLMGAVSILGTSEAQATFSIVAVDTVTGTVGGAGASCIDGSKIINDLIEGVGALHTQAYYLAGNQANAHARLAEGLTPDSIIKWLEANDVEGTPEYRQYGVVTLAGQGSSAGYTGSATTAWAGHITGPGYAIQGNILLGENIVTGMEQAFLNTPGPLEDKLMAALEAANVPGADTRCLSSGKPALSAFIKVLRIGDGGTPYLYQHVDNAPGAINPITRLRELYDAWKILQIADPALSTVQAAPSWLPANGVDSALIVVTPRNLNNDPPTDGAEVAVEHTGNGTLSPVADNGDGTFSARLYSAALPGSDTIVTTVTAGGQSVVLNQKPVVRYFLCGDANSDGATNIGDAVFLINFVFKSGPLPVPLEAGDASCDGQTNVGDAVYMINFVFKGGYAPCCP
jgi:uncharacterized Ntn-hydrolase superfamily protein